MLAVLEDAVDTLELGVDKGELIAAFECRTRLDAKLTDTVHAFDTVGRWPSMGRRR